MYVLVNLTADPPTVSLEETEDCARFHLAVRGEDPGALGDVLAATDTGWLLEGQAFIRVEAIRQLSVGKVGPRFDEDFSGMLSYAKAKGWLSGDETAIQAHITGGA